MKEVKSPKKPLLYYYGIVLLILAVFNIFVAPLLSSQQTKEVDYGTFMSMIDEKISALWKSEIHRSSLPTKITRISMKRAS